MCLSDAFELVDGERRPLMSYVSGISVDEKRDDVGKFLPDYFEFKIFESDPFASVDEKGVTLTDMLGARKTVAGTLKSVDLTRNVILIEAKQ